MNLPPPSHDKDKNGVNGAVSLTDSSTNPSNGGALLSFDGILPPPDIKAIVDKTAAFVAKSPKPEIFEEKIRAREKSDSRFAFLNKADAYHAYYQYRLEASRAGDVLDSAKGESKPAPEVVLDEDDGKPTEPPALEFMIDNPPSINAVDLDILRLTALFTARSGRRFAVELAQRESRNYQFDFLSPSHSLFGYFNRLVEQYTKILLPSTDLLSRLSLRSGGPDLAGPERLLQGRRQVLSDARTRVTWEQWESSRQKEAEDLAEKDRIAFAEIDWQDFVVVSTVEFTEGDEAGLVDLPPPMSLSEVENMTLAQKKMASMIMEGREDEVEENERERKRGEVEEMDMDDNSDDDEAGLDNKETKLAKERQKIIEIRAADSNAPMKIRKDYVPKAKRAADKTQEYTTFGNQQVPVEDFAEHLRIELLDPRWKEEKRQNEANRSASNLLPGGTDVSASFQALAAHRPDIFGAGLDDEARKKAEAEALAKSKARVAGVWDGHTSTRESITNRYQQSANLDEQIEALHRAKGVLPTDEGAGPRIGPAAPIYTEPVEPEIPSTFISGATISAAPQPNQSSNPYQSQYGQYGQAQYGLPSAPMSYAPIPAPQPIAGLPARPAVINPGEALGTTGGDSSTPLPSRPADDGPDGEPSAKRQRVGKKEDGTLWPEEEWIEAHPDPISIKVTLPDYPAKPEWGCDGGEILLENIEPKLLVATLRDRITAKIGLPIGKQKLSYNGRILANSVTLAGLNFLDNEMITLAIKDAKKK